MIKLWPSRGIILNAETPVECPNPQQPAQEKQSKVALDSLNKNNFDGNDPEIYVMYTSVNNKTVPIGYQIVSKNPPMNVDVQSENYEKIRMSQISEAFASLCMPTPPGIKLQGVQKNRDPHSQQLLDQLNSHIGKYAKEGAKEIDANLKSSLRPR